MVTLKDLRKKAIEERPAEAKVVGGRYRLARKLGSGGFGSVWLSDDETTGRQVALKLLGQFKSRDEYAVEALKNEFSILKDLSHPHICRIYDFGLDEAFGFYFTSEFIDGRDLLKATALKPFEYCEGLLVQIMRALSYLHSNGICHFDIKSGNILVRKGKEGAPHAMLIDFGISSLGPADVAAGTVGYMAPEMILKQRPDARADLYSAGVLMYELLAGRNPFTDMAPKRTMENHLTLIPPPPSSVLPAIPKYFDHMVMRLIEKNPADRYQSAVEVLRDVVLLSPKHYDVETEETKVAYIPADGRIVGRASERARILEFIEAHLTDPLLCKEGQGEVDLPHPSLPLQRGGPGVGPRVFCIAGGPGTGKSRLLRDAKYAAQLRGYQTIYIGEGTAVDEFADFVAHSKDHPALVIIDDLSFAVSSRGGLRSILDAYVAAARGGAITRGIIIYADDGPHSRFEGHQDVLQLGNFSPAEVGEYIKAVAGLSNEQSDSLAGEFMNRTRGNPALVARLCLKLVDMGYLSSESGRWDGRLFEDLSVDFARIDIPEAIAESLAEEIEGLVPEQRDLLEYMAAYGEPIDISALRKLTGIDIRSLNLSMMDLERHRLIVSDAASSTHRIADEFTRSVMAGIADSACMQRHHDAIAQFLKTDHEEGCGCARCYAANAHLANGGDGEKSFRAILNLVRYERLHGMASSSIERLEALLEGDPPDDRRRALTLELCESLLKVSRFDRALEILDGLPPLEGDLRAARLEGHALLEKRDFDAARGVFEKASERCGPGDRQERIIFNNYLGRLHMLRGESGDAIEILSCSRDEWMGLPAEQRRGVTNDQLGEALRLAGRLDEAVKRLEEDVSWFEGAGREGEVAIRLYSLAEALRARGDFDESESCFARGISIARGFGDSALLARMYNGQGNLAVERRRFSDAATAFERGLAHCYRAGDEPAAAAMMLNIGRTYNDLLDLKRAEDYLKTALIFSEGGKTAASHVDNVLCQAYLELGDVSRQKGDCEHAIEYLDKAEALAESREDLKIYKKSISMVRERMRHDA